MKSKREQTTCKFQFEVNSDSHEIPGKKFCKKDKTKSKTYNDVAKAGIQELQ